MCLPASRAAPPVQWVLEVAPEGGWGRPAWEGGVLALVIIVSFLTAALQFSMLISR